MGVYIYHNGELYHHGIKGQKWGVRRFQQEDGTLTNAGKKRYADDNKNTKKSFFQKRYDKHYDKYIKNGISKEESEKLAKGRVTTEKTLAILGGVAAVALAGYAVYRIHDWSADSFIEPGQEIQTSHHGSHKDRLKPGNPFYAAFEKKDKVSYASKVFSHFDEQSQVTTFTTKHGINVASRRNGEKIFKKMMETNPEFAKRVNESIIPHMAKRNKLSLYDSFCYNLVKRGGADETRNQMFYEALRKHGYGAVVDSFDSKTSRWTYKPIIIFDKQQKIVKTVEAGAKYMGGERASQAMSYSNLRKFLTTPISLITANTAIGTGTVVGISNSLNNRAYVNTYRQQHPRSTLTDKEILELLKRDK